MGFVALLSYIVPFQAGADHRTGVRAERNSWPEYNFRTGVFEREPVPANIDSDILASESIIIPDDKLKHALIRCQPQQDELGRGYGHTRRRRPAKDVLLAFSPLPGDPGVNRHRIERRT